MTGSDVGDELGTLERSRGRVDPALRAPPGAPPAEGVARPDRGRAPGRLVPDDDRGGTARRARRCASRSARARREPFDGEMLAFVPPSLMELRWADDVLRFELEPDGIGVVGVHPAPHRHLPRVRQGGARRRRLARLPRAARVRVRRGRRCPGSRRSAGGSSTAATSNASGPRRRSSDRPGGKVHGADDDGRSVSRDAQREVEQPAEREARAPVRLVARRARSSPNRASSALKAISPSIRASARPDAVVDAPAEAQRRVVLPAEVELVRALEARRVVVGRSLQDDDAVAALPAARRGGRPAPGRVRRLNCTGLSKRSSSSTAEGAMSGWARQSASWSGWRSSARSPLPSRLVVVSKPAAKSRMAVEVISSSVRRSSLSRACTSALKQVVARAAPALLEQLDEVARRGRRWPRSPPPSPPRSARARSPWRRPGRGAGARPGPPAGTPTSSPMTAMGSGQRELGHEVDLALRGQAVEQIVDQLVDGRTQALDLAGRERARDQSAQPGVVRRVRQQHVVLGRRRGTRRGGCPRRRRCPSSVSSIPMPRPSRGRAARRGTPRSR